MYVYLTYRIFFICLQIQDMSGLLNDPKRRVLLRGTYSNCTIALL